MIRGRDLTNNAVGAGTLTTRPAGKAAVRSTSDSRAIIDLATHAASTVTPSELATYWSVNIKTIYRDIAKGALPASKLPGGSLRIRIADARRYGRPIE